MNSTIPSYIESRYMSYLERVREMLLKDFSSQSNIVFGTDSYERYGDGYGRFDPIDLSKIVNDGKFAIRRKIDKDDDDSYNRGKKYSETFTPSTVCKLMNDVIDDEYFGIDSVFSDLKQIEGISEDKIKDYVNQSSLEVACGEAPFLCSPYDSSNGNEIPIDDRIGMLDRKMHLIYANSDVYDSEVKLDLMLEALSSCYGYEYQGDNLFVARINMLDSFSDHYNRIMHRPIDEDTLYTASRIISECIVQMDGMSFCTVADGERKRNVHIPFNGRNVSFSELGNRLLAKRRFYAAVSNPLP